MVAFNFSWLHLLAPGRLGMYMAASSTPKKLYPVLDGIDLSSCRLCGSVGDAKHCKNLFRPANAIILEEVENVHGNVLLRDKALPHLICRPCERRAKNASNLKKVIADTQNLLIQKKTRAKRCIDMSPSASFPQSKTRRTETQSTRMALNFETDAVSSSSISQVSFKITVSILNEIYNINIMQKLQSFVLLESVEKDERFRWR